MKTLVMIVIFTMTVIVNVIGANTQITFCYTPVMNQAQLRTNKPQTYFSYGTDGRIFSKKLQRCSLIED